MRKLVLIVAALVATLIPQAAFAGEDLNCDDFPNQAAAQSRLDSTTGDPDNLDADHDGIACEDQKYASDSSGGESSGEGNQTEGGTLPRTGAMTLPLLAGGIAFIGLGTFLVRRNRTA